MSVQFGGRVVATELSPDSDFVWITIALGEGAGSGQVKFGVSIDSIDQYPLGSSVTIEARPSGQRELKGKQP